MPFINTIRYSLLAVFALLAVVAAWQMFQLPLWGYYPLFLFVGIWGIFILTYYYTLAQKQAQLSALMLSVSSGILLSLGFPNSPLTPLLFVAFVPMLHAERHMPSAFTGRYFYNTFVIWNILTTYWVSNSALVAGMIAIWLNAFFMTVPMKLFSLVRRQLGDAIGYVAFVCFWLSWEHLHLRWELSWPWLTLGNAFAQQPNWVQWYEFTGVPGGGIWIMVANILILYGIKNYPVIQYRFWFYAAVFILIPIGVSYIRLSKYNHLTDAHHEVAIIQPNYEPHYEKFVIDRDIQLQKCLRLAQSCLTPTTEYLVFPETTFEGVLRNNIRESEPIRALQLFAKQYPNLNIVSGVDAYKVYNTNEPLGKAARYSDRRDVYWESYNAAVQLSPNDSISFYLKSRLVPGPEIIPYRTLFFFIEPLVDKLGGSFAGLGTQAQRSVFTYEGKKIAPVICYESIYGEYITEYIRAGAQAIFIMTNDGWWDDTAGYLQHLKFGALRAIETRRYIARAANTGTSSVILPTGEITQSTAYGSDAAFIGKIGLRNEQTFYVQYGDYLSRIAIFFTILIFGIGLSTFIRVRRRAT